jgi:hypothetical protein
MHHNTHCSYTLGQAVRIACPFSSPERSQGEIMAIFKCGGYIVRFPIGMAMLFYDVDLEPIEDAASSW